MSQLSSRSSPRANLPSSSIAAACVAPRLHRRASTSFRATVRTRAVRSDPRTVHRPDSSCSFPRCANPSPHKTIHTHPVHRLVRAHRRAPIRRVVDRSFASVSRDRSITSLSSSRTADDGGSSIIGATRSIERSRLETSPSHRDVVVVVVGPHVQRRIFVVSRHSIRIVTLLKSIKRSSTTRMHSIRHSIRTLNRFKPSKAPLNVPSPRLDRALDRARSALHSSSSSLATLATMRARDGVEEDLSAYAREDRVQGETRRTGGEVRATSIARANGDGRRAGRRGRVSRRRRRATRERDRDATETRARARRPRARSSARTRRVESIRIDSIRSIDRSNERPTEWAPDRTNERSVCDA